MNPLEHWEMMAITVENFPVYDLSKCHKINSTWKFTKHEARENGVGVTHSGPIGVEKPNFRFDLLMYYHSYHTPI
ncbi:2813_t:CDS:2 [Entrophospora sp. SA101]|nr:6446_t:CDS:2 [Entrophospora sp. SA101]CAJ0902306.1 2813_t:CDS:2 [Entrophospora sp. SA101]